MADKKPNLFQQIYDQTKELARKAKAPLVQSAYKQKFVSAAINKTMEIADLKTDLSNERAKLQEEKMDSEKTVNIRIKITRAEESLQEIQNEYKDLFGSALVIPK